ncbi:hypothetical protein ASG33_10615 [Dyadobacter sp. Leaf189]|nr:hypothetical protein ASG33_10615 [Dyadobacter sp. Leaf189]
MAPIIWFFIEIDWMYLSRSTISTTLAVEKKSVFGPNISCPEFIFRAGMPFQKYLLILIG